MLIRKGLWSAKGSVVYEGSSLGVPVEVDLEIVEDQDGITLTGALEGAAHRGSTGLGVSSKLCRGGREQLPRSGSIPIEVIAFSTCNGSEVPGCCR